MPNKYLFKQKSTFTENILHDTEIISFRYETSRIFLYEGLSHCSDLPHIQPLVKLK